MKKLFLAVLLLILCAATAQAIPALQVAAPANLGDTGTYADYQLSLTNPTEEDTAVTSGNTLYVAGAWGPNTVWLGGQYDDSYDDWEDVDEALKVFNTHDAILMATVPFGTSSLSTLLTVNGASPISPILTGNISYWGNNGAPVPGNSYMYFDVGNFAKTGSVPDFDDETGAAAGEIKTLTLAIDGDYDSWIHFGLMALQTDQTGNTTIKTSTSDEYSPNSHDVTWKFDDGGGGGGGGPVPEPSTIFLLGIGLLVAGGWRRKKKK